MKLLTSAAVSLLLIGLTMSGTAYSQVPQIEREALIALYNSTDGANWTTNTGWNGAAGTECDWAGVTCTSGTVTGIKLNSHKLTGSIPAELGNLTSLEELDLTGNTLTGSIPEWLGNLSSLAHVGLGSNRLSGSIPTELGNLSSLVFLSLDNNVLTGSIPTELGNLASLEYLQLPQNSLTGSIPTELGNLSSLKNLSLHENQLSGTIPVQLGNLTGLRWLSLDNNALTGSIPTELGNLTNLSHVNLGYNQLAGPLPQWLSDMAIPTLNVTDAFGGTYTTVSISGGSRTVADTDGIAGESVSFTGIATAGGGTFATTQWLVGDSVVATGLTPSIALPNGSTVVTFKATDDAGVSLTRTVTITVVIPTYTVTDEWPSPYNGVTPDSSLGLAFNNIGIYDTAGSTIYTCLRVFTDGLPGSVGGIGEFDIGLTIVSLDEGTVQVTKYREFNVIGALNENVELPDCSGKFETTTGIYTDIIEAGDSVLETTFSLTDSSNLILTLQSYETITAPN